MNFYNTLLVISKVDCSEFHQALMSEKISLLIAMNFYNTLSNFDGELL